MKNLLILAFVLSLGLECNSQTSFPTTGHWFNWSTKNYSLTVSDFSEIVSNIQNNKASKTTWYTLPSGNKYQILHPQEWLSLVIKCYQFIDPNVDQNNIISVINNSEIVDWSNDYNMKVKNFCWSEKRNEPSFTQNYSGLGMNEIIQIIIYEGYPVLKIKCGNPLLNYQQSNNVVSDNNNNRNNNNIPENNPNLNNNNQNQNGNNSNNNCLSGPKLCRPYQIESVGEYYPKEQSGFIDGWGYWHPY